MCPAADREEKGKSGMTESRDRDHSTEAADCAGGDRSTVAQRLIWAGAQLTPDSPLYNMAIRVDFAVAIDPERFRRAFEALVAESDAMRTVFSTDAGALEPRVLRTGPSRFEVVDLSREDDPEHAATSWIDSRARRPFDLGRACFDSVLLRLGAERWTWFLNQHHIATDAWSKALIYRRVGEHYARNADEEGPRLDPLPTFSSQIAAEQRALSERSFAAAAEHWRKKAERAGGPLRLYGRPATSNRGESRRLRAPLGLERMQRLARLASADGVRMLSKDLTKFTIFQTALVACLARVSGERTITVGSLAHNRRTPEAQATIGLFVELFPLGATIEDGETFRSLFQKVAREANAYLLHARPGASTPASARSFSVVLNYINKSFGRFGDLDARVEWVHPGASDPGHALRVHVHDFEGTGELDALFDVNAELFDSDTAERIPRHFLRVLDAMLSNLDTPIDTISLALDDETAPRLVSAGAERTRSEGNETVLSLFDLQAQRTPDAPAVRCGDTALTYRDLRARSFATARDLINRGVAAGDIVGIHAARSIEMVVAVLGVLRAGASYVPLEANLPEQRLRLMLEDTRAKLVVTQEPLADAVSAMDVATLTLAASAALSADATRLPEVTPHDIAYVLYTSGSTGRPKGVVVDHRGLAGYARWAHRTFAGEGPTSMPLHTAFGFDLTVTSLFVPLISGGTVVVYPEPHHGVDLSVVQVFEDDDVDIVKLTPAHLGVVADQPRDLRRIHALILGGEELTTSLAQQARRALGDAVAIYNEYGPTEAVVGCMSHRFDPENDTGASVPIGAPADDVAIYVLDDGLNPVPDGVDGEIFIAGERLARGYLGRDDLTAERFVPDPFRPGDRMYRSGDRARCARGLVEYRGRSDSQVKIRGVRVEPAEVEQALLEHHAVRSCVVELVASETALDAEPRHCARCGLSSRYPGTSFDADGVCNICRDFDRYRDRAQIYFKPMEELHAAVAEAASRRTGPYDCLMLLSGGKDSTYALYQLARITPRILTMTLDNGYISDGAKANIRRAVDALGIEHRFVTTPAMNEIFVDSLKRHSNVCDGCFKAIYTLAVNTALEEGIPAIVTGLSRGQFFETRLTSEFFLDESADVEAIDRTVLEARKAYHLVDDAVSECLDVSAVRRDDTFDKVTFIDFYRYCDVTLDEVYEFLSEHAPWVRPGDTGRSTNCLVNDVGIYFHTRREGFHNYALPYSWDVRLGHKNRDDALDELDDDIDPRRVAELLEEMGYDEDIFGRPDEIRLAAYYTADAPISPSTLRNHLAERLIGPMIPNYFIRLDEIPLTSNGKVDRQALPDPRSARPVGAARYRPPSTPTEHALAELWRDVLRVSHVGIDDNFYDLGGDSIAAIQIVARARDRGLDLAVSTLFEHQTVALLAEHTGGAAALEDELGDGGDAAGGPPGRFALAELDEVGLDKVARLLDAERDD
jgi:amino acid adenylation domain-containing protein